MVDTRQDDRTGQRARGTLRALGALLSTYQLYPGDLEHAAAQRAVRQVRDAVSASLARGPVVAEIRGGALLISDEPVQDDRAERLARACYERRVEHLVIEGVPSLEELEALCRLLTTESSDVEAAGGAGRMLADAGVASLRAGAGRPQPTRGRDETPPDEVIDPGEERTVGLDEVDLDPRPGEHAEAYYERLRSIARLVDGDEAHTALLAQRAAQASRRLQGHHRARFGEILVARAESEAFAERLLGHYHDVALAGLIQAMAAERGEHVEETARDVVRRTGRRGTVVRLALDGLSPRRYDGADGAYALAAAFPTDSSQGADLGVRALADYLSLESEERRLAPVLSAVTAQLGAEVRAGRRGRVEALLGALDEAAAAQPYLRPVLQRPRAEALSARDVADAASAASRDGRALDVALLEAFGDRAVDALVEALDGVANARAASSIEDALVALGPRALPRLSRLVGRPPGPATRRLAPVLHRIGGEGVVAPLERLGAAPDAETRTRARRALAALEVPAAADALARFVEAATEREDARALLRSLAAHPHPRGREVLAQLASGEGPRRLARGLRREARRLAREVRH